MCVCVRARARARPFAWTRDGCGLGWEIKGFGGALLSLEKNSFCRPLEITVCGKPSPALGEMAGCACYSLSVLVQETLVCMCLSSEKSPTLFLATYTAALNPIVTED